MIEADTTLIVLLIILSLGLIIPEIFRKFKLPFITIVILLGAIIGPNGFNYIQTNEIIEFFGFLGMAFLMLMAGIETDITKLMKSKRKVFIMAFLNGSIPFLVGFLITRAFGYDLTASILVGIIFISSSVAIIVPSLKTANLFDKKIGQLILSSVLVTDIISLLALGFIFQRVAPVTKLSLPFYYLILILSLIVFFILIPRIYKKVVTKRFKYDIGYERKLRLVIVVLVATLAYFSFLGVHPILASFLVGLMLSPILHRDKKKIVYSKIHSLGYGLFVPIFFFVVGMEMDLELFRQFDISNVFMILIILGLVLSKFISGYVAGRIVKLENKDSLIFGSVSIIQLTTTLAVTFTSFSLGLLNNVIVTSIILLSISTTLAGPIIVSLISKRK